MIAGLLLQQRVNINRPPQGKASPPYKGCIVALQVPADLSSGSLIACQCNFLIGIHDISVALEGQDWQAWQSRSEGK